MQLNNALAALSHENTFLLSLMYTGRHKPVDPGHFEVVEGSQLKMGLHTQRMLSSVSDQSTDAITGAALLRLLPSFNMDKTYAYREGMNREIIEYIFVYNNSITSEQLSEKNISLTSAE